MLMMMNLIYVAHFLLTIFKCSLWPLFNYVGEIERQHIKALLAAAISPLAISPNP